MTGPAQSPTVAQVLAAVQASHSRFAATLGGLTDEQVAGDSYADEWTIAQVSSHLGSGAEVFMLFLDEGLDQAHAPGMAQFGPIWAAWDAKAPARQARESVVSDAAFLDRVATMTPEEQDRWRLELFGSQQTLAGLLLMRLAEHALHTWDIAVMLDPTTTVAGDAAALVIDNLAVLVQRVGRATSDPVAVEVRTIGPDRRLRLSLGPDGVTLTAADTPFSAAVLTLPGEAFVRLVYGRLDPVHTPTSVTADGIDLDLLRHVFPGV